MAWGDKGTLFVGSFSLGNVYAIKDNGGKREVKTVLKGLNMPTGLGVSRRLALRRRDQQADQIRKRRSQSRQSRRAARWCMTICRPTSRMAGNTSPSTRMAGSICRSDRPFNIGIPPTSVSQIRRVDPKTGNAEIWALGVRNSVGGDVDPRSGRYWFTENARDWISDDMPSDKLNMITKIGEHFGYPYCHQGDYAGPEIRDGSQVLGIHAAGRQSRGARRAARHEVLYRRSIPRRSTRTTS